MEYPVHAHDIRVSDPHILADKATGKYYMTCSGFGAMLNGQMRMNAIGVRVSEDLIHWTEPICVFLINHIFSRETQKHVYKSHICASYCFDCKSTTSVCQAQKSH